MKYPKGHDFEYRMLYPAQIRVDPLYQRPLDDRRVTAIVKAFNGDVFNEPKVSYRDGAYWVFDGQHSIAAWKKFHNGSEKLIRCKVYLGMTWLDECERFMEQNGISKDPTTLQKLRAAFNSKDPDVVDMVQKAELCGYKVDFSLGKSPTRIVAVAALFRAYKRLGPERYLAMLTAIRDAWYGDEDAISNHIISGMTTFYANYYGNFDHNDLVRSLKRVSPSAIIRQGKALNHRTNTYAREIVKAYNSKRKYKLDDTNL